jgi:hypothetical protein
VVARGEPLHWTVEVDTKFEPVTVSVVVTLPAAVEVGLKEEITAVGELTLVIVNV